jgi:hypothetical protein
MKPALKGLIVVIIGKSKIIFLIPVTIISYYNKNNRLSK